MTSDLTPMLTLALTGRDDTDESAVQRVLAVRAICLRLAQSPLPPNVLHRLASELGLPAVAQATLAAGNVEDALGGPGDSGISQLQNVSVPITDQPGDGVTMAARLVSWGGETNATADALSLQLLVDNATWIAREQQLRAELAVVRERADQLAGALESNRDIGAAVGILMAHHRLTRQGAFDLLRRSSQERHVKLRDLALEVTDTGVLEVAAAEPSRSAPIPRPPVPRPPVPRPPRADRKHAPDDGQQRLRTVIDSVPAMIGYWDLELRNVLANRAYKDWFGMTSAQIHGQHIRDVIGDKLYAMNERFLEGALAGQAQHFDRTIIDASGVTRYSRASYLPDFDAKGAVAGFSVLVADVGQSSGPAQSEIQTRRSSP